MTKKDTMAKLPGLFKREGVFQLRTMIPKDLQGHYGGRAKFIESLGTPDADAAKATGTAQRACRRAQFERKRRELNPQRIEKVTPELAAVLAQRVTSTLLGSDDTMRTNPEAAKLLLGALRSAVPSKLTIDPVRPPPWLDAPVDPLEGLTAELAGELARVNAGMDAHAALQMASQRVAGVLPMVKTEGRKLGLLFDEKTPGAMEALRECLKAYRKAWQDIAKRDRGEVVATPQAPSMLDEGKRAESPTTLRAVFTRWKTAKRRSDDSVRACERALELFEKHTGDTPVRQITRAQGDGFRAWLQTLGSSSKTAHDRLTWVKSLMKYADRDLEAAPYLWAGIDIDHRTEKPRKPWTENELRAFFSLPLFTQYALPSVAKAGGAAAYWVPLLGLYTGARVGELCQLRVSDIEEDQSGAYIRITDEAEGARVKTEAGLRTVPLHSELIRLGFLDYVKATKQAGAVSLWPDMRPLKGKPGAYFSDWVNPFHKAATRNKHAPVFHELRHTVRTAMTEAGFDGSIQDRITGHEVKGSTGTRVYAHPKAVLRRAVESIRYEGLRLPRAYGV